MSTEVRVHLGRNISRIRELRRMKQDTLAMGLGISQQAVSKLEQCEKISDNLLAQIAVMLNVTVDVIRNFTEEAVYQSIDHLIEPPVHPVSIEKIIDLYERLLASEKEKVAILKEERKHRLGSDGR